MSECVFIGGPYDGEVLDVARSVTHYNVPERLIGWSETHGDLTGPVSMKKFVHQYARSEHADAFVYEGKAMSWV